jgi:hypothetical protein
MLESTAEINRRQYRTERGSAGSVSTQSIIESSTIHCAPITNCNGTNSALCAKFWLI